MTTKKTPAKKAAKKAPAAKTTKKASRPLRAVPDVPGDEHPSKVPEGKEDGKEAEGQQPKRIQPERIRPTRPKRPAIPQLNNPEFKPDPSLLGRVPDSKDWLRVLLYGDQGVGKSTNVGSLTEGGRVAVLDPENSIRRKALANWGYDVDKIDLWPDWTYAGVQQFYTTIKAALAEDPDAYFAVAIDTGTSLAEAWLEETVEDAMSKPHMIKKHPERELWDVFQEDYGALVEKVRRVLIRMFYTLPCHVVVTAHSRRAEDETGAIRVGPSFSPAVQSSMMVHSDWVLRLESDRDGKRVFTSQPRGQVMAKDRFGVLAPRATGSLFDLIRQWDEFEHSEG